MKKPPQPPQTKKNILLVYPKFPTTYWGFQHSLPFLGFKAVMPPLGLLTVAALLPNHYRCRLVDMNIEELTDDHLHWADAVFTSTMIAQEHSLEDVVHRANAYNVPVVSGGPHPTTFYDTIKGVSHFILGEVEGVGTLEHFLNDFEAGRAHHVYASTTKPEELNTLRSHFGDDGMILLQRDRPDLNNSPTPRFDLLTPNAYQSMAIQTSRGCPIGCEFCDIWRRFGTKPRLKSADKTLRELDALYHLDWRASVFIVDDNFISKKDQTKQLLHHIAGWQRAHHYPFNLYTEATINMADDAELLTLMRDAGFNMVFVGIETPVTESLTETHKYVNTKRNLYDRVQTIQRAGIEVSSGFIIGFDNDPEDIAQRQIDFIQHSGIPIAMVGMLTALRDTDLYERLEREGRILTQSTSIHTHTFEPNFITKMPREQLVTAYKQILHAIYDSNLKNYFARCTTLIKNLGENPHFNRKIQLPDIRAALLSLATQPFKKYGREYLAFLGRTLAQRPRYLPEAIRLAIMGHHFYKHTDMALSVDSVRNYFTERLIKLKDTVTTIRDRVNTKLETLNYALHELQREKQAALHDATQKLKKLSRDYRDAAHAHYTNFLRNVENLFQPLNPFLRAHE